jgi:4'-phosphopantetheinyl transferase
MILQQWAYSFPKKYLCRNEYMEPNSKEGFDRVWSLPPTDLVLLNDEVHVWRAFLDLLASRAEGLGQQLTEDEVKRAQRFVFQKDRTHFIVARGLLRVILGGYLGVEPSVLTA